MLLFKTLIKQNSGIHVTNPSELNVCFLLKYSSFCLRLLGERGSSSPRGRLLEEDIFGSESEAKRINCWLWLVTGKENNMPATAEVAVLYLATLISVPFLAAKTLS